MVKNALVTRPLTISPLFQSLNSGNASTDFLVLVSFTDRNRTVVKQRALTVIESFHNEIRDGLLKLVAPNLNIYPAHLFRNDTEKKEVKERLPYGNSRIKSEWQSKLALDFAFLFSVARAMGSSDYFLNWEDDVRPARLSGRKAYFTLIEQGDP